VSFELFLIFLSFFLIIIHQAIDVAFQKFGLEIHSMRTLIIHSGGDSRRAPFHSVTGKAWASLNALVDGKTIASPMALLIHEISFFSSRIPSCSITVASCDVLLDISPRNETEMMSINIPNDAVTIIGVPEKLLTAKNHVSSVVAIFTVYLRACYSCAKYRVYWSFHTIVYSLRGFRYRSLRATCRNHQ